MSHIDEVIDETKKALAEDHPWQIHKKRYKQPEFQVTKEVSLLAKTIVLD